MKTTPNPNHCDSRADISWPALSVAVVLTLATRLSAQDATSVSSEAAARQATELLRQPRNAQEEMAARFVDQLSGGKPISLEAIDRAMEKWSSLPKAATFRRRSDANFSPASVMGVRGTVWVPVGPSPMNQGAGQVNGTVAAIAINPNNPNLVYQGALGGGVWRSIDGGLHWTPLFDQQASLGLGQPSSIAIDPNNTATIYVGTSSRFNASVSKGILKSTDGGGSWIALGSGFPAGNTGNATNFVNQNINTIIVEPSNGSILYLGAYNGLFRSTNAGVDWTQGTGGGFQALTLVLDPSSPAANRVLYAGTFFNGIHRSSNGGRSWTPILSSATPVVATALAALPAPPAGGSGPTIGKVVVTLPPPASPANPAGIQVIYASIEALTFNSGGGAVSDVILGIFRSTDGGTTWTQRSATGLGGCQCFYTHEMAVDPASPGDGANDILFWGGTDLFRSTDSGANFTPMGGGQHADHHATMVFFRPPSGPSTVYTGTDGGIYKSTNGGTNWSGTGPGSPPTINAGGLQTTLIYNIDIKHTNTADVTLGSFQDNGTARIDHSLGSLAWTSTRGSDGWDNVFDPVDVDTAYAISDFSSPAPVLKSPDSGQTWPTVITGAIGTDTGAGGNSINVDPINPGIIYVAGYTSLWQSRNGGGVFRSLNTFGAGGGSIDVARANSNNVVYAVGTNVFVSRNVLAATVGPPSGVTFTNIRRNLPARNVARVAFDPNDPSVIYATLGGLNTDIPGQPGHVFRTTIGGSSWTDISPALDIPFTALVLDGTAAPTSIYVGTILGILRSVDGGANWTTLDDLHFPNAPVTDMAFNRQAGVLRASTFGRGVFELAAPSGPVIAVNAENGLDFGESCDGKKQRLTLQIFNVGTANLIINSVARLMGSTDFAVLPNPATPLVISPNAEVDFTVEYTPNLPGPQKAIIRIASNDPGAPFFDLMATATRTNGTIATLMADNGNFGSVCIGSFKDLLLTINNNGGCDLSISNITSSMPQFKIAMVMFFPLVIHPGVSLQVPIRFEPTERGFKMADLIIQSSDPQTPRKTNVVFGTAPVPRLATTVANSGSFGDVCIGTFKDLAILINNAGGCDLLISNIMSSDLQFAVPAVMNFPLVVHPGDSLMIPIRLKPVLPFGAKSANITITSNDPDTPSKTVSLTGNAPSGDIRVTGSTDFGDVCAGLLAEKTISICNVGLCDLRVTNVSFVSPCPDFRLIGSPFPTLVSHDFCIDVVIRFTPTSCGAKTCTLVIQSDDPDSPVIMLTVTANSPCADIDVPPDLAFLPEVIQNVGDCKSLLPFPISNKGQCNLTITSITIGGANAGDFGLSGLPSFPIILQPGHIVGEGDLSVVFGPTEIDRDREATITVTYVSDPLSGATTSVTRKLCGEGVYTGARVLVTQGGIPVAKVERIHLQRINANRNRPRLDTQDNAMNLPLVTVVPAAPCEPFQYHREYGTVSNPIQLLPGSYQVTATAIINGKRRTLVVGFDVQTCDFNPTIVVDF